MLRPEGAMSYTREEVKAITDKVLNLAKADAVEVRFSGGERSATRYANSTITANLVEHDQEVLITVYYGDGGPRYADYDVSLKLLGRIRKPYIAVGAAKAMADRGY